MNKKIISLILIVILILITTGCSKPKKCIKSHQEKSKCILYTYVKTGETSIMIPYYYSCTKTICDEYEDLGE